MSVEVLTALITNEYYRLEQKQVGQRFGEIHSLRLQEEISNFSAVFTSVTYSPYWVLKIKAICSSETSVDFQSTIRRHIPGSSSLQRRNTIVC
jgi:hypothetical protein